MHSSLTAANNSTEIDIIVSSAEHNSAAETCKQVLITSNHSLFYHNKSVAVVKQTEIQPDTVMTPMHMPVQTGWPKKPTILNTSYRCNCSR